MKKLLLIVLISVMVMSCKEKSKEDVKPPVAEKIKSELVLHGDTRLDFYHWMNDPTNPKVIQYLEDENEYLEKMMAHTDNLKEKLYKEMVGRIKQDDQTVPFFNNGYYYYSRYEEEGEYPIYCRKKGSLDAEEEVIIDVPELARDYSYFNVGSFDVSFDNKKIAFTVDTLGRRQYTILIKDLGTKEVLHTSIKYGGGDVVWAADNKTIFFTSIDSVTLRYDRINRLNVFDNVDPVEVYYEEDETYYYMGVSRTKDDKYITIETSSTLSNEIWVLPSDDPIGVFKVFQPREKELEYYIEHFDNKFYIITNLDAPNYRLMETPDNKMYKKFWQEVIPHRESVFLENMEVFEEYLVLQERSNALRHLRIIGLNSDDDYYLEFEEDAYTVAIYINREMSSDVLRYSYTSLTTPNTIYDYNMKTGETVMLKQTEVLGGFDKDDYETKRYFIEARDGREVPLTLVYRKGIELNGDNPTMLYGYGSYGARLDPRFSSNFLSLLDRGFVIAYAHIRGGQEMGRYWYEEGRLKNKKNTFYDFIDCAEFLIEKNYTNPQKLFGKGGSAGGLLIGAVANMRPDLFLGMIANVPFVDVVTTMLDESIPLTTAEYDEWGNPNIKADYDYMLSYSPYDNVKEQNYPNMLITSGLHDSQVQYFEPTKWIAKLREYNTADTKMFLHTNMEAGHGGASGRFRRLRELAVEYAFMLDLIEED